MTIIKRPAAKQDLIDCGSYIALDNPTAADNFLVAAEKAFEQLSKMPELGPALHHPNSRLQNMRFWPVTGFLNYLVFYFPLPDGVEIVRVLHGAREWERVLEEELNL
ncbi:MAG: type II toxin-antitoxin system RelE/ParE family toxin [Verrucomicrobiota bacterium]